MTIDHSVTCASAISTIKLADRVEHLADPDDARELARRMAEALKHPERSVGAVFTPKGRGGTPDWLVDQRTERTRAYRDAALAEYGTEHLTPGQADKLVRKINRMVDHAQAGEDGDLWRDAARRIRATGLGTISGRHLRRVLPRGD